MAHDSEERRVHCSHLPNFAMPSSDHVGGFPRREVASFAGFWHLPTAGSRPHWPSRRHRPFEVKSFGCQSSQPRHGPMSRT